MSCKPPPRPVWKQHSGTRPLRHNKDMIYIIKRSTSCSHRDFMHQRVTFHSYLGTCRRFDKNQDINYVLGKALKGCIIYGAVSHSSTLIRTFVIIIHISCVRLNQGGAGVWRLIALRVSLRRVEIKGEAAQTAAAIIKVTFCLLVWRTSRWGPTRERENEPSPAQPAGMKQSGGNAKHKQKHNRQRHQRALSSLVRWLPASLWTPEPNEMLSFEENKPETSAGNLQLAIRRERAKRESTKFSQRINE